MSLSVLTEIEERINQLSPDERIWLMGRLAYGLRKSDSRHTALERELAAMAADPAIQREIQKINEEFAVTEADGLENL
jgi:hypothetical protein